jgi:hypothetical protein
MHREGLAMWPFRKKSAPEFAPEMKEFMVWELAMKLINETCPPEGYPEEAIYEGPIKEMVSLPQFRALMGRLLLQEAIIKRGDRYFPHPNYDKTPKKHDIPYRKVELPPTCKYEDKAEVIELVAKAVNATNAIPAEALFTKLVRKDGLPVEDFYYVINMLVTTGQITEGAMPNIARLVPPGACATTMGIALDQLHYHPGPLFNTGPYGAKP